MTLHVFVGPTLTEDGVLKVAPRAVVHRPVRHGDLLALHVGPGDTLLIIDGVFHQTAPVRHKEIIDALARGARVIGASSMGALRAAELWQCGMEGVGLVFSMYAKGALDADDEVAVSHLPSDDHQQRTIPLVSLRWTVANGVTAQAVRAADGEALIDAARTLHYTERTWPALVHATRQLYPAATDAAQALREFAQRHPELSDLKRRDALLALSHALDSQPASTSKCTPAWMIPRTMYLERWRGIFRPAVANRHATVCELDVLRFQQLYAPDFPTRYRKFALTRIAGDHLVLEDRGLVHGALIAAGERGVSPDLLPSEAWAYWLTPEERRDTGVERRLLTLMVRSFRSAPGAAPFHDVPDELRGSPEAWESSTDVVAAAIRFNQQMERTGTNRIPKHLPSTLVRRHLEDVWQAAEPAWLEAAARDRGFLSLAEAEDAARPFVLLHRTGAMHCPSLA